MSRRNKKIKWEPPVWIPVVADNINYFLLKVRKDATDFVIDNAMGYLIYKVPAYENWITDDILQDPGATLQWLDKYENSSQYKNTGARLPDNRNYSLIGLAVTSNTDYWEPFITQYNLKIDSTLIIKPTQP